MNQENIARVCHQANKAFCESIGDLSQSDWYEAAQWQRDSAIKGVAFALSGTSTPELQHQAWCCEKVSTGWKFGPKKDAEKKEHPCLVPYDELPQEQRAKDHIFLSIVESMKPLLTE